LELSDEADAGVGKEKTSGFDLVEGQFKIQKSINRNYKSDKNKSDLEVSF
jgi:hypothetical protein